MIIYAILLNHHPSTKKNRMISIKNQLQRPPAKKRRSSNARFLGMTAQQRFLILVMLMFTVCIMGTLAMFVLGKMSLF